MNDIVKLILQYTSVFLVLMIALPMHEFAHAFAAVRSGDDTPRIRGRYTLNPFAHFDPVGFLMLLLVHFGWAKPVPINPYNFRNLRRGYFWTSIAGVLTNITLAFLFTPLLMLVYKYIFAQYGGVFAYFLLYFFLFFVIVNVNLCIFNLIPVYPLDGYRILELCFRRPNGFLRFMRNQGYFILLGLFGIHFLTQYIPFLSYVDVFGYFMEFVAGNVLKGFISLWGLIIPDCDVLLTII